MFNKNEYLLVFRTLPGLLLSLFFLSLIQAQSPNLPKNIFNESRYAKEELRIKEIFISGNTLAKTGLLLNKIPYKIGAIFDPLQSEQAINNLYELGYFSQITLEAEVNDDNSITLYFLVQEKQILEAIEFVAADPKKKIDEKKIREFLQIEKFPAIDEETAKHFVRRLTSFYQHDNHHQVSVTYELIENPKNNKIKAIFTIDIGARSSILHINFVGNTHIPDRKLRKALQTQERWLLGFLGTDGMYVEEIVSIDKLRLASFYKNNGYLAAKVYKTETKFSNNNKDIDLTFFIEEGPLFTVTSVEAPEDDLFSKDITKHFIPQKAGTLYSEKLIHKAMTNLQELWGEAGYINADVSPQIIPDEDSNTVSIKFQVERDKKLYVNRILITGNHITRDKVIRRQLAIDEGDLITTRNMALSKKLVEYLSFFKKESVNWRLHRITDELADLEMNITEEKTGQLDFQIGYGSEPTSNKQELRGGITIGKRNLFGLGLEAGTNIQASSRRSKKFELHFFDPHVLDSNVSTGVFLYSRVDPYDQWSSVLDKVPEQTVTGSNIRFGFRIPELDRQIQIVTDFGIENITNNNPLVKRDQQGNITSNLELFESRIKRTFQAGTLVWAGIDLLKDTRNHQMYPNDGYKISFSSKAAPINVNGAFSFIKAEAQASCYTQIIGKDSLVLGLQAKISMVQGLKSDSVIPYKELFHIGGQNSIRGFTWGGAGPAWKATNDPLGGRKAIQFNAELIFPLLEDQGLKAHLFYDAGCGWDTQLLANENPSVIIRNHFDPRHAVGFGFNVSQPMPAKIDWGFKLDRRPGESASEFHLSMNYAW